MVGTVNFYSVVKGSGELTGEDGNAYKFKMADFKGGGYNRVKEGDKVEFTPSGLKASQLVKL